MIVFRGWPSLLRLGGKSSSAMMPPTQKTEESLMRPVIALALSLFAAVTISGTALANPRLVSASPGANATVAKPAQITLTFSEALVAALSGIDLTMIAMPGMADHPRMPVRGFATKVEGKTLTAKLPRPLPAGTYELKWHVVAANQHRIEGSYTFTAR